MPDARAALKVARPQAVGGYELRIPKEGLARQRPSGGRFTTGTDAPQGGSVEASNLHGATSAGTAVLPKRSDSPKGTRTSVYRGYPQCILWNWLRDGTDDPRPGVVP